jgi:TonB family protein
MSGIERAALAAHAGLFRSAATAALGLALAALAGCAQAPATPDNTHARTAARGGTATATKAGAKPATCAKPVYPQASRRKGSQGTTTLSFLIDTDGSVAASRILKSSGDAALDEAARASVAQCQFKPAMKDGKPEPAWVAVQYVWSLEPALPPAAPPAQP